MGKKNRNKGTKAQPITHARLLRATRYDSARNDGDLRNHWRLADSMSADASMNSEVRRKIRERARYEIANNSYAMGVALAISNAVVGSGAKLQVLTDDKDFNRRIEWEFAEWAEDVRLTEKLRSMRFAKFQDGESFAVLHNNPRSPNPVKLDVTPIDCERVASAYNETTRNDVDGITLDEWGNPISYRVLTRHPGTDAGYFDERIARADRHVNFVEDSTIYDAKSVLHWYRRTLPEQHRGLSEICASLPLFALLRRYTLAVVTAAETAADFAAFLCTDSSTDWGGEEKISPEPFEELEISRGMISTLPEGWKPQQLKAEQPTSTYSDFKREILGEIGRSLQIPVNIVAGDSSRYNYASGRLDHQEFQKAIRLDQRMCGSVVMTPIFRAWLQEWSLVNNHQLPVANPSVVWYFDGFEHVDPAKEANAQATRLESNTTTLMTEYAKQGLDWEDQLIQRARELDLMRSLNIPQSNAVVTDTTIEND